MSERVVQLDTQIHQTVQQLLPWYLGQQLSEAEASEVEAHLAVCTYCQEELRREQELQQAHADLPVALPDVEQGLARWHAGLAEREASGPAWIARLRRLAVAWRPGWQASAPWLRGLVLAQALVLVALLSWWRPVTEQGSVYRTLGASEPAQAASLLVRFKPEATELQIRGVLQQSGTRLVDGPTGTDAYLLATSAEQQTEALAVLLREPIVVLAVPLDGAARP
ncbi:zf-HC2 domain-containing protein [Chitinimonas sp.]|uniref:anti-sigma factor family protein n=1 Tax=Chitinimonas sp. TaxID=1934313 RepID=UPI002F92231E